MRVPALTMAEAQVVYGILYRTWIPTGETGELFQSAVKKLGMMARAPLLADEVTLEAGNTNNEDDHAEG